MKNNLLEAMHIIHWDPLYASVVCMLDIVREKNQNPI